MRYSVPLFFALVFSALVPVSALGEDFESGKYPAAISGSGGSQVLGIEKEKLVTCKKVTFTGELVEQAATVSLAPTYDECTAFGIYSVAVEPNGCVYELYAAKEVSEFKFEGTTDIVCPEGKKITISGGTCKVEVGSQSGLGKVTYDDNLGEETTSLAMEESLTGIKLNVVQDGVFCLLAGTGEKTEGTYTGASTSTGSFEAKAVGFAVKQDIPTKLCKQNPKPALACAAGQAYKDVNLEFVAEEPAQETKIKIMEKPTNVKNELKCDASKVTGTSKGEVGNPLPIQNFTVTFDTCVNSAGKTCDSVTMENAPTTVSVHASAALRYAGAVFGPMTIRIKCKGEVECRYKSDKFPMSLFGATVAVFDVGDSIMEKWALGGGMDLNCYDRIVWRTSYPIVKPGPLWVTR